jgi:hypothetical protein
MLTWNAPASVINIRSLLGLVGYHQRFVKGFLKITKPMTKLLGKDKNSSGRPLVKLVFRS